MRNPMSRIIILMAGLCLGLAAGAGPASAADIPRPEYPRPEMVRAEWLNLNGWWEFALDLTDSDRIVFLMAYAGYDRKREVCHLGCKGITIYRDRSRDSQVLSTRDKDKAAKPEEPREIKLVPKDRPRTTWGFNEKVATGCGNLYVAVFLGERGELFEVFGTLGKAGGCASAQLEAINRLISLALRSGVEAESIVKQLKGIRCPSIARDKGHAILSCADAIAGVLERYLSGGKGEANPKTETKGNPVAVGGLIRNPVCRASAALISLHPVNFSIVRGGEESSELCP